MQAEAEHGISILRQVYVKSLNLPQMSKRHLSKF